MKEIIKNSILKNEKGAITLYVSIACLFVMMIGIANYVIISNKQTAQIEQLKQIEAAYTNGTTSEAVAKSYVGGDVIPIYTPQQMAQVGSGENVYVPQSGKVYTFTDDKTYVFYGQSQDLTSAIDSLVTAKMQANVGLQAYPVGSIYISVNNTNPSEIFGGTWVAYGTGRTLVGVDTTQAEFDTIEETGGEKTHTLTTAEMPSHTHTFTGTAHSHKPSNTAHTFISISAGNFNATSARALPAAQTDGYRYLYTTTTGTITVSEPSNTATATAGGTNASTGGGEEHNNLQPYITVYMWKRTQ